ncbi:MAG TPA: M20/M25/M40 family metallo-hydrolase [Actinomycetota bacterium]|nr:M20/M25/M40 family metallo-hydrolase [Actinomycetota bacterium]
MAIQEGAVSTEGDRSAQVARLVDERFETYLERIRELCRMPSVSGTGEGIRDVADRVRGLIEDAGGTAELVETEGHPVVLGDLSGPPGAPRLVRYGMYDVQPAEEPDWTVPPFGAEIVDLPRIGPSVVCRGVANSKGSLAAFFCALEVLRDTGGVPVGIAFVVEGEEELGSPHLRQVVESRAADLGGDAGFDLDLCGDASGRRADLYLGCKGLLSIELVAESGQWGGPGRPLHSSEMAWIDSPVWALVQALGSLVDRDQEPAVDALAAAARGPTEADRALLAELAEGFAPDEHLREVGASRFRLHGSPADLLQALIFRPTVNIDGLEAGYTGPGGKTIIPNRARAVLDVRLVPDLDPDSAAEAIRAHLDERGFGHVRLDMLDSYPWGKSEAGSPVERAMRASYERIGLGTSPYPMAPWCAPFYLFDRVLSIPWASGGAGYSGGAHGPDEFATVEGLRQHIVGAAEFVLAFARLGARPEQAATAVRSP